MARGLWTDAAAWRPSRGLAVTLLTTSSLFAGLLIIVAVDHPFSGTLHVPPEAVRSDFVGQG